jgi:hypothetical protein
MRFLVIAGGLGFLAERHGSGDGEGEALMTRQMPYEPLAASVMFELGFLIDRGHDEEAALSLLKR